MELLLAAEEDTYQKTIMMLSPLNEKAVVAISNKEVSNFTTVMKTIRTTVSLEKSTILKDNNKEIQDAKLRGFVRATSEMKNKIIDAISNMSNVSNKINELIEAKLSLESLRDSVSDEFISKKKDNITAMVQHISYDPDYEINESDLGIFVTRFKNIYMNFRNADPYSCFGKPIPPVTSEDLNNDVKILNVFKECFNFLTNKNVTENDVSKCYSALYSTYLKNRRLLIKTIWNYNFSFDTKITVFTLLNQPDLLNLHSNVKKTILRLLISESAEAYQGGYTKYQKLLSSYNDEDLYIETIGAAVEDVDAIFIGIGGGGGGGINN